MKTNNSSNYSIEKYLIDTHQTHHHNSEHYAAIYEELQKHKLNVLLKALL
jgi:hypothetical protein